MKFQRAFHLLTYTTALWAFLALISTGQIHLAAIVGFAIAFLVACMRHRTGFRLPDGVWTLVNLVAFCTALFGWFYMGQRMYSATYFFFYLEANKLLTAKTNRDYLQVFGLTFFHMLAASVSTESVAFAPMLAVYMFLIIAAMMVFTIKRDAESTFLPPTKKKKNAPLANPTLPRRVRFQDETALRNVASTGFLDYRMTIWLCCMTLMVLLAGTGLFWVIPRAAKQNFIPGLGHSRTGPKKSGFADNVTFEGVGEIQTDPAIVMRAAPDAALIDRRPEFLRIRGTSLDEYTGRAWQKSFSLRFTTLHGERSTIELTPLEEFANASDRIFQVRISLEPESSDYFFTLDQPSLVDFGTRQRLEVDVESQSMKSMSPRHSTISYTSVGFLESPNDRLGTMSRSQWRVASPPTSEPDLVSISLKRLKELPAQVEELTRESLISPKRRNQKRNNLQLPEHPDIETVTRLSEEWTEGLDTPLEIASEIEHRFKSNFDYSLDTSFSPREDHLSYFLEIERKGHCEYFATAMALMLRARGIPARIVNGYLTDEWSPASQRYIVRQEHAHSWVEAQVDGSGRWMTFDPTPSTGIGSNRIGETLYHHISRLYDAIKVAWYDSIVDFSVADQEKTMRALIRHLQFSRTVTRSGVQEFTDWWHGKSMEGLNGKKLLGVLLVLSALIIGAYLTYEWRRAHRSNLPVRLAQARRSNQREVRAFLEVIEELERLFPRPPAQTPLQYARQVAETTDGAFDDLLPLTQTYYQVRYHHENWPGDQKHQLATLRQQIRAYRKIRKTNQ